MNWHRALLVLVFLPSIFTRWIPQIGNPISPGVIIYLGTGVFPFTDAGVLAAYNALPLSGGTIDFNGCNGNSGVIFSNPVTFSTKPVFLRGNIGNFSTGCALVWNGPNTGVSMITFSGVNAHGSRMDGFDVQQGAAAASNDVAIGIQNGIYDVTLTNVSVVTEVSSWAIGIDWGNTGSVVVNGKMYNVRVENATVGFAFQFANAIDCYSCSSFQNSNNVVLGDATHLATNVTFHGGNVETDSGTAPNFVFQNVQAFTADAVYGEISGGNWGTCSNTANLCKGIRVFGGYLNFNGMAANAYSFNLAGSDLVSNGQTFTGVVVGSNIVQNTNLGFGQVTNFIETGSANIGIFSVNTAGLNISWGPGLNNGSIVPVTNPIGFTSSTFANLPTAANGTLYGCSDCTSPSNPCTGASTGALAVRQNGAWVCK